MATRPALSGKRVACQHVRRQKHCWRVHVEEADRGPGGSVVSSFLLNVPPQLPGPRAARSSTTNVEHGRPALRLHRRLWEGLSFNGANGSKFNLFGFNFKRWGEVPRQVSDLTWKNWGAGTNFVLVPPGSAVLIDGDLQRFELATMGSNWPKTGLEPRTSEIAGFNGAIELQVSSTGEDEISATVWRSSGSARTSVLLQQLWGPLST
jgi:hypothetical protein